MKYSIQQLQTDVMARLGETARPQGSLPEASALTDVPSPEDIIRLKAVSHLGEVGGRLISGAPGESLGGAPGMTVGEVAKRLMTCGLYAAEVRLPEGFLRLASAKMTEWKSSVDALIMPGVPEWTRQWSAEARIAGCADRPRGYLDSDGAGSLLRLIGSKSAEDSLEWVSGWCVPVPDEEGEFDFPASLYPHLVGELVKTLISHPSAPSVRFTE